MLQGHATTKGPIDLPGLPPEAQCTMHLECHLILNYWPSCCLGSLIELPLVARMQVICPEGVSIENLVLFLLCKVGVGEGSCMSEGEMPPSSLSLTSCARHLRCAEVRRRGEMSLYLTYCSTLSNGNLPLVIWEIGWASWGSSGEVNLVMQAQLSWWTDQLNYFSDPDPGISLGLPQHLKHLWLLHRVKGQVLQNKKCRISMTPDNNRTCIWEESWYGTGIVSVVEPNASIQTNDSLQWTLVCRDVWITGYPVQHTVSHYDNLPWHDFYF